MAASTAFFLQLSSSSVPAHCHGSHTQLPLRLRQIFSMLPERPIAHCPIHRELATGVCQVSPTRTEQPTGFRHVSPSHTDLQSSLSSSETMLPHGLDALHLPRHVAIIMDGNSRWAESRGLLCTAGHEAGMKSLKHIIKLSIEWGIHALTVFAFSTENWQRPQAEVSFLMKLFQTAVAEELETFIKANVQVRVIGDTTCFPPPLQLMFQDLEQRTTQNTGLKLTIAASYGGRYDITRACQKIATNVWQGKLNPEDITDAHVGKELGTNWIKDTGDPDLLIRTGGERRLSNFLLWQLAYTELLFLDTMWPDFSEVHYADALLYYERRNRRYGGRPIGSLT